ncbi:UDP-glucose dehydrogenase family protein [Acidiferrimicrobium sp. IK]|uniref:UDP-glucose dehydrogenase family protein n=1 Tax=Acidiferrimicrobium sp. IK TaxID=2871700 RepID=UPI0021CB6CAB|nr:UDP-glucose/GDP-mannose dehydrogenase family protein [Acidiferrimicrobium sp. IK]
MSSRVAVIGTGYVGTVVAGCLAHIGHQVIGVESDAAKLVPLRAGRAPFHEPGLDALLAEGIGAGTLSFTDDFAAAMDGSDVVFVCVGTPSGPDGLPDMTAMVGVARSVAANLRHHHVLVNKSTVPIGSGRWLASVIEDVARTRIEGLFSVVSNPEFLREGNAVHDYLHPDRVVLGSDDPAALDTLAELYQPILSQTLPGEAPGEQVPLVRTDLVTAEMTKYASNAFLATKISFANEIARLCEMVGADITEVTAGMGLDTRIGGRFLDAGLGWGGSCFGKDVSALISTAGDYGYRTRILEAAVEVNEDQRNLVVEALLHDLKTLRGARIALLGLAFKPGTDDLRDSPAVAVAERLVHRGCFVTAFDPVVGALPGHPDVRIAASATEAAWQADAVVLATDWQEFLGLDLKSLRAETRGDLFFDGRNIFDPGLVEAAGFRYRGIGRGVPKTVERVAKEPAEGRPAGQPSWRD